MPDRIDTGRQPGWRIVVAATAVTLTGGIAAVNAGSADPSTRVTLDAVVPMQEVGEPTPLVLRNGAIGAARVDRHDSPFGLVLRHAGRVAAINDVDQATADSVDPTPNTPNTPDPTPNTPDPTPNTPDSPDSPDPSPDTPDGSPESPD